MFEILRAELRAAARALWRRPGLSALVVTLLAAGIGAAALVFSLIQGILLEPLPFLEPERLVSIWERSMAASEGGGEDAVRRVKNVVSPANFLDWRAQSSTVERMAGFAVTPANLTGAGADGAVEPRRVRLGLVTEGWFEVLGVAPALGRTFTADETVPGGALTTVLADHTWRTVFGGDPDVLGRSVRVDGRDFEVIGVMPPGMELDMGRAAGPLGAPADLWTPLPITEQWQTRRGRWMLVIGRVAPGAGLEQARAELATIAERLADEHPDFNTGWSTTVVGLRDHVTSSVRSVLLLLFGAVLLVLLIVCANVAALLLARTAARADEIAVRGALGATRRRLLLQLLGETVLLFVLGAVAGLLAARVALGGLARWLPADLPRLDNVGVDARVASAALLAALLAGVVSGLVPALWATGTAGLRARAALGGASGRLRSALVGGQAALALVLLAAAGALLSSVRDQLATDPGFETDSLLSLSLSLPRAAYPAPEAQRDFFDRLLERVEALPGVRSAGAVTFPPLGGSGAATSYWPIDRPEPEPGEDTYTDVRVVAGDFHRTLGIPLVEGRLFESRDRAETDRVPVVVSRELAEQTWPGRSVLGQELAVTWGRARAVRAEVIGVVGDVRFADLVTEPRPALYFPLARDEASAMTVMLSTRTDPETLAPLLRATVGELDPELPIESLRTMRAVVHEVVARDRFALQLVSAFAVAALLLSAIGLYGAVAFQVRARRAEIGLRLALGASPRAIGRGVVLRAVRLVALSAAVGVALALAAGRLAAAAVAGGTLDRGWTLAVAVATLLAAGAIAAALPAWRAARLDPARTLRSE
ncbi:MAG TPA: ADOP family duplicated permease [Thermoanaerobaculia bacterium]|nr:ADOP family duplicated permease [Thermoanaerobaculia bacterium]